LEFNHHADRSVAIAGRTYYYRRSSGGWTPDFLTLSPFGVTHIACHLILVDP
jgi:hypothetical protein